MAKKPTSKASTPKTDTKVVSFRLAADLHALLEQHAEGLRDETGTPLNASGLARRLVIAGIPTLGKPSK